jgi:hypothetical protein
MRWSNSCLNEVEVSSFMHLILISHTAAFLNIIVKGLPIHLSITLQFYIEAGKAGISSPLYRQETRAKKQCLTRHSPTTKACSVWNAGLPDLV